MLEVGQYYRDEFSKGIFKVFATKYIDGNKWFVYKVVVEGNKADTDCKGLAEGYIGECSDTSDRAKYATIALEYQSPVYCALMGIEHE